MCDEDTSYKYEFERYILKSLSSIDYDAAKEASGLKDGEVFGNKIPFYFQEEWNSFKKLDNGFQLIATSNTEIKDVNNVLKEVLFDKFWTFDNEGNISYSEEVFSDDIKDILDSKKRIQFSVHYQHFSLSLIDVGDCVEVLAASPEEAIGIASEFLPSPEENLSWSYTVFYPDGTFVSDESAYSDYQAYEVPGIASEFLPSPEENLSWSYTVFYPDGTFVSDESAYSDYQAYEVPGIAEANRKLLHEA